MINRPHLVKNSVPSKEYQEYLDIVLKALIKVVKKQIDKGRSGPKILDVEAVRQLFLSGHLKVMLTTDNPPYLELVAFPLDDPAL